MSREGLQRHLAARGPITVADFMDWCLTGRDDAYYRTAEPIGRSGDFITAPEVSQIFGELVGLWAGAVWLSMGRPAPVVLAELGPGRGTLMKDALRALCVVPGFQDAVQVHLVERSERLRHMQADALGGYAPIWHETLDTVPGGATIILANEFFDALPISQYIHSPDGWRERVVALNDAGDPVFTAGERASPPASAAEAGAILETRRSAQPFITAMGSRGQNAPMAALVIDYGYQDDSFGDTLQAVSSHGYADPLEAPGAADLSAHVNFAELARLAASSGLTGWGPLPQGEFLLALGLEARLQKLLSAARPEQQASLVLGARRLTDPYQMGALFKAMALTSAGLPAPPPFTSALAQEAG